MKRNRSEKNSELHPIESIMQINFRGASQVIRIRAKSFVRFECSVSFAKLMKIRAARGSGNYGEKKLNVKFDFLWEGDICKLRNVSLRVSPAFLFFYPNFPSVFYLNFPLYFRSTSLCVLP